MRNDRKETDKWDDDGKEVEICTSYEVYHTPEASELKWEVWEQRTMEQNRAACVGITAPFGGTGGPFSQDPGPTDLYKGKIAAEYTARKKHYDTLGRKPDIFDLNIPVKEWTLKTTPIRPYDSTSGSARRKTSERSS